MCSVHRHARILDLHKITALADTITMMNLIPPQADVVDSGPPLSKKGYLYKGPFPSDGAISVSMKVCSVC